MKWRLYLARFFYYLVSVTGWAGLAITLYDKEQFTITASLFLFLGAVYWVYRIELDIKLLKIEYERKSADA